VISAFDATLVAIVTGSEAPRTVTTSWRGPDGWFGEIARATNVLSGSRAGRRHAGRPTVLAGQLSHMAPMARTYLDDWADDFASRSATASS